MNPWINIMSSLVPMGIGIAAGCWLAPGLERLSWRTILARARHLYLALALPPALMVASLWLENRPDLQWQLPFWVQVNLVALSRIVIYGCTGYVLGIFAGVHLGRRHPQKWLALGLAIGLAAAIPVLSKPAPIEPVHLNGPSIAADGTVLQSTSYTCVPAVLANILKHYGVTKTEAELAKALATSQDGTSSGSAALELRRLGFEVKRITRMDRALSGLTPPALLLVDSDTHVVAYFGLTNGLAEIVDPTRGRAKVKAERLAQRWTGRALEVSRGGTKHEL